MTTRPASRFLGLRPFSGQTLADLTNYVKRDVARAFADLFAILGAQELQELEYRSESIGTALAVSGGSTGGTASLWLTRIEDVVQMRLTFTTGTAGADATATLPVGTIPSWATPTTGTYFDTIYSFANGERAYALVGSDGGINMYFRDDDGTSNAWPSSTTVATWNVSWNVN